MTELYDDDPLPEHPTSKQYYIDSIHADPKTGLTTGFDYLEGMYADTMRRGEEGFQFFKKYRDITLTEGPNDYARKYDERFLKYLEPHIRRRFLAEKNSDPLGDYRFAKRAKAQKTWFGRLLHHPIMYKK